MKKTLNAIRFAINGIRYSFTNERNVRIEIFSSILVILVGFLLKISSLHWLIIILNISFVLTAELINTAIEKFADFVSKEINPAIKIIKDIAASAVIISVIAAAFCGLIIFVPYILKLVNF